MADSLAHAFGMLRRDGWRRFAAFAAARIASPFRFLRARARLGNDPPLSELVALVVDRPLGESQVVFAMQKTAEILPLLERIRRLSPRIVVEIGTAAGGNLLLLVAAADVQALIVSIDLPGGPFGGGYGAWRVPLYRSLARGKQRLVLLRGSSHSSNVQRRLHNLLAGRPIDVLFVDGDHSLTGVRADFLAYAPLVRPGGLVVFHDIMPDLGQPSLEVHKLWRELARSYEVEELVESPGQRGYGLGVLAMPAGGLHATAAQP